MILFFLEGWEEIGTVRCQICFGWHIEGSEDISHLFIVLKQILHGGGAHKVPALISKIRIFKRNTATATKFGEFS